MKFARLEIVSGIEFQEAFEFRFRNSEIAYTYIFPRENLDLELCTTLYNIP